MTRPAVYGALSTYLLTLRSAQARASGSASTACTLARGTSWPIASAIAPEPGAQVGHHRLGDVHLAQPVDGPAGHDLGLRARHEHARAHVELEVTEMGAAGDVLERLARGAAGDLGPEPRVEVGVAAPCAARRA